jgi:GNAT superfamily N-acetyltransferase
MSGVVVREMAGIDAHSLDGLCEVLIDCVDGGASVSFMWPMTREKARAYWLTVGAGLARGDRALIVAQDEQGHIVGTAQAIWAAPENQPHRADVAKMLVHRRARRLGVGGALLAAVERVARAAGKTLLVLDTASDQAERLYERGGWQRVGTIPRYALLPDGPFCDTVVFYKDLTAQSAR